MCVGGGGGARKCARGDPLGQMRIRVRKAAGNRNVGDTEEIR